MGARTLQSMRDEVRLSLGNRSDVSDSVVNNWIYSAYLDVSNLPVVDPKFNHRTLERTTTFFLVVDQRTYLLSSIASDVWGIISVRNDTNDFVLEKSSVPFIDKMTRTVSQSPTKWARFGDYLEFDVPPLTADTLSMRYIVQPTQMADSDVTVIDALFDDVIVLGAVARGFDALLDHERALSVRRSWSMLLAGKLTAEIFEDRGYEWGIEPRLE